MAWHENKMPSIRRQEKKNSRKKFIKLLSDEKLSEEIKDKLIKAYDKGH